MHRHSPGTPLSSAVAATQSPAILRCSKSIRIAWDHNAWRRPYAIQMGREIRPTGTRTTPPFEPVFLIGRTRELFLLTHPFSSYPHPPPRVLLFPIETLSFPCFRILRRVFRIVPRRSAWHRHVHTSTSISAFHHQHTRFYDREDGHGDVQDAPEAHREDAAARCGAQARSQGRTWRICRGTCSADRRQPCTRIHGTSRVRPRVHGSHARPVQGATACRTGDGNVPEEVGRKLQVCRTWPTS